MKNEMTKIFDLLAEFRELDPNMPMQMAATFIAVARNEGINMTQLTEELNISQSSCSRNVAALSAVNRANKKGHDLLVSHNDPEEHRRKVVRLTHKGKLLAKALLGIVE